MNSRPHIAIGNYLRSVAKPSDVVVTNEIGAIGYHSDLALVDLQGLIDSAVPELLTRPTLDDYVTHILAKSPRFVLLNDRNMPTDREMAAPDRAIFERLQQTGRYEAPRIVPLNDYKHVLIFVRH